MLLKASFRELAGLTSIDSVINFFQLLNAFPHIFLSE